MYFPHSHPTCTPHSEPWHRSPLGQMLLAREKAFLDEILPKFFGYYLLQLGGPENTDLLSNSLISNHLYLNPTVTHDPTSSPSKTYKIRGNFENLPFQSEGIDAVVAMHILEFAENPRLILEQIYHTLTPGGHLIIFGFNPFSLWRIHQLLTKDQAQPWCGRFVSLRRVQNWLTQLGFSIEHYQTFAFRYPTNNINVLRKTTLCDKIGRICWPNWGGCYIFIAEKRATLVTPLKQKLLNHGLTLRYPIKKTLPTTRNGIE